MEEWLWLALLGLGTGSYAVLVGAGGGLVLVPMLLIFFNMKPEDVAGTSLALVAVESFSGSLGYGRLGLVDRRSGLLFAAAAIPGSVVAPFAVEAVAGGVFRVLFGLILVGLAVHMLLRTRIHIRTPSGHLLVGLAAQILARTHIHVKLPLGSKALSTGAVTTRRITTRRGQSFQYEFNEALAAIFNLFLGFMSAFFGTGGGFLRIPVLVTAFGFPVRVAVATSIFALFISATAGSVVHASLGHVDWYPTFVWAGVGLLVGAQIGAQLATRVGSVWILRLLVVLLLVMGGRLLMEGILA